MTAPVNTVTTVDRVVGQREDLEDVIYRTAPEDTPFTSVIGKVTAKARYHEWQTETLATPITTNAQLEGDDYAAEAGNLTTRVGNYCQIGAKAFTISRTADIVDKAGRDTETARQKAIKGLELKRDFEARFCGNLASNNESGGTPRRAAGALAWIETNESRGATGAPGGINGLVVDAATAGTQREFTETQVRAVMALLFQNRGGSTARGYQVHLGAALKQKFSQFTGISQIMNNAGNSGAMATIVGGADMYRSDFGMLTLIPHPYALTRDAMIIDPDMWAVATLDPMKTMQLGATGDSMKWLITCEKTLVCRNQAASAVIADLL